MKPYIFLPNKIESDWYLAPELACWLKDWLTNIEEAIEHGSISSSECVQGLLSELLLYGEARYDWLSVERELLRDDAEYPMAYSKQYGRKLYKFDKQWRQMPVYAIYNSFWLNSYYGEVQVDKYQELIYNLIQPNGWIYNREVSNTQLRTRMKSELFMSFAMGIEILCATTLSESLKHHLEASIASRALTEYISAEYFRYQALQRLELLYQFPEGIGQLLYRCEAYEGYNDFCVSNKIDDYMGTKKRTWHDFVIPTPLISGMAQELGQICKEEERQYVEAKMKDYAEHLRANPMKISAFTMRDIDVPFGSGITPLEVIASAMIVNKYTK